MKALLVIALVAFIIIFGPLVTIWSINTLFSMSIAYTFDTWLASLLLFGAISTKVGNK